MKKGIFVAVLAAILVGLLALGRFLESRPVETEPTQASTAPTTEPVPSGKPGDGNVGGEIFG